VDTVRLIQSADFAYTSRMTRSARSALLLAALTSAFACASRYPQPVEPYSPDETAEAPSASASAVSSAPSPPAAPSEEDVKTEECQKLGSTITANSEMLKGALDKALENKDVKGLGQLATSVEEAGSKVKDLDLKTPRLKSWSTEYQSLMSEMSDALRKTATDRAAKDKAALKKDLADIRSVDEKEGDLVKRINRFCSG